MCTLFVYLGLICNHIKVSFTTFFAHSSIMKLKPDRQH